MNQATKFFALFAIILLTGAGCFSQPTTQTDDETIPGDNHAFSGSLANALDLGQSMKCTWSDDESEGVVYVKGEKARTETQVEGTTSYIINDGECSYIWEENSSEGFVFCASGDSESITEDSSLFDSESSMADDQQPEVDVDCTNTNVKDNQFDPPNNVTFSNPFEDLMTEFDF